MSKDRVTQDRIKVTVEHASGALDGPWATITGQEAERDVPKLAEEAGGPKAPVPGRLNYGDVTVTRLFRADRDAVLLSRLNKGEAFEDSTITEQYLDSGGNAVPGRASVHTGCCVASFSAPEGDANSSDAGHLTLTFSRTAAE